MGICNLQHQKRGLKMLVGRVILGNGRFGYQILDAIMAVVMRWPAGAAPWLQMTVDTRTLRVTFAFMGDQSEPGVTGRTMVFKNSSRDSFALLLSKEYTEIDVYEDEPCGMDSFMAAVANDLRVEFQAVTVPA